MNTQLKDLLEEYCFYKSESVIELQSLKEELRKNPKYPLAGPSMFLANFWNQKAELLYKGAIQLVGDNDINLLISRAKHNYHLHEEISFGLQQKLKEKETYANEHIEKLLQQLYADNAYLDIVTGGIEVAKATDIKKFAVDCEEFNSQSSDDNFQGQFILEHLS